MTMDDASKRRGRVKFYDQVRGFGFISPDDDQPELFFHATGIDDACEFEPESGDVVEFVGGVDRKGKNGGNTGGHLGGQGRRTDDANNNGGTMTAKQQPAPAACRNLAAWPGWRTQPRTPLQGPTIGRCG